MKLVVQILNDEDTESGRKYIVKELGLFEASSVFDCIVETLESKNYHM